MRKIILLVLVLSLLISGCGVYGSGTTFGYVTTVEEGIFWDKVWIRSDLESSQTNCFIITKQLKKDMIEISKLKQRIEAKYERHFITATMDCNDDIIFNYKVIPEVK